MQNEKTSLQADLNRRSFLKSGSFATLAALMGGVPIETASGAEAVPAAGETKRAMAPPLNLGLIGCGKWGREVLKTLAIMPNAPVVAICDTYAPMARRAKRSVPNAETYVDYQKLLADKKVQGVIVATPTHQHREIVVAAMQAGKHVYCEAPLGHTVEEARAIALAAKAAYRVNFQTGLQYRSDSHRHNLIKFIRTGALGKTVMARSQFQKKTSWRAVAPTPEREAALNWRLDKNLSPGLIGEIGIHQLDMISLFMLARPVSISGFGGILFHRDGREVADTVTAVFEFPNQMFATFFCTLANSFDSEYDMYYGSDSAIMIRENKAWMFKEVDAPLLGWEVYAKKTAFLKETGIALDASATKLKDRDKKASENVVPPNETPLYSAMEAFITNSGIVGSAVEDYVSNFGDDPDGVRDYVATALQNQLLAAGYQQGFEATVTALKANEALVSGQKLVYQPEWYNLA